MAKIVIVGGGVSGLSAGIYLAMAGHDATICERHKIAGGNLTGWRRQGCVIDNCIHWLTGTNPATDTYKTWVELGALGGVSIKKCDSLYTYSDGERSISLCRDLDALEAKLLKISPSDRGRIKSLMKAVRLVQYFSGIGGKSHDERARPADYLGAAVRLGVYAVRSTGELADGFKSELIQGFLRSFLGDDFTSLALITVFAHFTADNADLPEGGSIAMADRMVRKFKSSGGKLLCGCEVVGSIKSRDRLKGVMLASGEVIEADYFIFACDPEPVFKSILSRPVPMRLGACYKKEAMSRFSSYQAAFLCSREALPFKGDYIFAPEDKYKRPLHCERLILREFSHEPRFAPGGCSIIQTMTFLGEEASRAFIDLRNADKHKYDAKKARLAKHLEGAICHRFPTLNGTLRLLDIWTPATYERYTGSKTGSYMSFLLPKSTLPSALGATVPGIKNAYLATQWQRAPGGLPVAAEMGKRCAQKIIARESTVQGSVNERVSRRAKEAT